MAVGLSRSVAALVLAGVLASAVFPAMAGAESALAGTVETVVGGGHDTNMFLQFAPETGSSAPGSGWFGHVAPALIGTMTAGSWRLESSYGADYRMAHAAGRILFQEADLSLAMPQIGRLRLQAGAHVAWFEASPFPEEAFRQVGAALSARVQIADAWRTLLAYRFDGREYPRRPAGGQDVAMIHSGEARLSYRPVSRAEFSTGTSFLAVAPALAAASGGTSGYTRVRTGIDMLMAWDKMSVSVGLSAARLNYASGARYWQPGAGARVRARLSSNLDAALVADWTSSVSPAVGADFSRRLFMLEVVAHASVEHRRGDSRPPPAVDPADLRPVIFKEGIRFRVRFQGIAPVFLVGSWNDWATPGLALAPVKGAGVWEVSVALPAGRHRYHFVVDGRAARPPAAAVYLPDGFGGEDAVLDVPGDVKNRP